MLPKEGDPANVAVMDGNNQVGTVGAGLPESLTVRITDPSNRPVVGARVLFVLGNNATGGDLSPDTLITGADGEAQVRWVLGTSAGSQTVQARVIGFTNVNTSLTATANPAAADTIFALRGDGQVGTAGAALAESLVVQVNDQYGNPVSGTVVGWTISGGGSVSPTSVPTGGNGQSGAQRTLGPGSGTQAAAASAAGLKGTPVIFTHTAGAGAPVTLQIIQGNNDSTPAGFALAESLVVRLVDANGNGVAGRAVAWAVTSGGGAPSPASTTTDANGLSATRWTLGTTAGANTLIASAAGFVANFTATGTSDIPTQVVIISGNNQTGPAGQALPNDPTVEVRDVNGNGVANVGVNFVVTGGGGTIVPTTSLETGANGRASLTSWTLGPAVGPNTLQATANGPNGPLTGSPLTFTATAVAGAATQLTITTQPPTTAASGVALSPSPIVQLRDAGGNPVSQAGVNVTVSLASGTGPLGGTLTRATNSSGQATFTGLSINGLIGSYTLAFNSSGLTGAVSSSILLAAGPATKLVLTTQPPGGASSGVLLSPEPIVQVQDAAGNPVSLAGVNVTAALTGATGTLGGTTTIVTNASGAAVYTDLAITGPSGTYSIRFTSTNPVLTQVTSGNITIGAGAPTTIAINAGNNQTATAGATLPTDPSVVVRDAGGNPVSGVTVTFVVASGGGSITGGTVLTNSSGIAAVGSWTIGCVAGANTLTATSPGLVGSPLTFTATGNVGSASVIQLQAGDNQTATVGTPVAVNPQVLVTDGCGNPVPGVTTTWAVTGGGGSTIGGNTTTDANGFATVGWILGSTVGTNTLTVTRAGLTGSPITFTATAVTGSANNIAINGGNNQSATINTTVPTDPSVIVTDGSGNPVSGVQVTFAVASGGGSITGPTPTTNASGIATVGSWTLGTTAGTNTLTATAPGLVGSPLTFTATGTTGAASTIAINGGNNQTATVGTALPVNPSVIVRDIGGNPVAGVNVTFAIASGGGSITGAAASTDAGGIAAVGSWTLGTLAGSNTITATAPGLAGSPITFSATGTTGGAATIAINGGNNQTANAGNAVATDPSVIVRDGGGNPVSGVSVTFTVASGGGQVSGGTQTTNASGIATVGNWTLGDVAGPNSLTATAGSVGSVTFDATGVPGAANAAQSTAVVPGGVAGSLTTIQIQLRDAFGNNRTTGGSAVTVVITGANAGAATTVTDNSDGTYTATYTPALSGTDNVGIRLSAVHIGGSPYTSVVVSAGASTIAVNGGNNQSDIVNTVLATDPSIKVTDAGGNPVSGIAVTFAVAGGGGSITGANQVTNASGIATVGSWRLGTTAGTNTLTATAPGLAGSPVTFTATGLAGAASAAQSTATVPGGTAGSQTSITIQSRDQFGNLRTSGGASFTVAITGANTATGVVNDNGDGTYTATYTPQVSGNDIVTIRLSGTQIGGSPYGSTVVKTGSATSITGHTPDPSLVGGSVAVSFTVTGAGAPTGTVTVTDGSTSCNGTLSGGSGSCNITLNSAGTVTLTATYGGDGGHNGSVSAGVPHDVGLNGTSTAITGHAPDPSVVGQAIAVNVSVTSGGGTPTGSVTVTDGTATCNLTLSGGSGSCNLTPTTAGTKTLEATYAGAASFSGSTSPGVSHQVDASGGVSPSQSTVGVNTSSITASNGSSPVTVTVTARDAFGNSISGVAVVLAVNGSNNAISQPGLTDGSGVATGSVSSTLAEGKTISATIDGTPINQTQAVTVNPAAVDAAASTATVPAGTANNPTTITVQGKDQFGNNVTVGGATVEITVTGTNSAGPIVATDNGNGTYTASYTPLLSGPDQIAITLNGTPISGSPYGTTVAAGSASRVLLLAGDNQSGPIGSTLSIEPTVVVEDGVGNPVSGVNVTFTITGGGGSVASGSGFSGANGQVGVAWTLGPAAGPNSLSVSASGLSGSPVLFSATATPGTPSVLVQSHTPDPSVVGELVTVSYSVTSGIATPTGNVTVSDGVDSCSGTVAAGSCSLVLTTPGARTLTADYAGDPNFSGAASPGVGHTVDAFGAVDPAASTASVPDGVSGNVTAILIVTRDQFGNQVTAGGAAISVDIGGANPGSASVTDNGDGTYTAEYTPAAAGADTITIQVNSIPIQGSPYTSTVS